ncbi:MAG: hypothetical protein LBM92_01755, partial [Opitutaceae bacterium]|nr:hypothetical protein [Opitutaceae bacterium]
MKKIHVLLSAILVFSGATIAAFGASSSGLQRAGGPSSGGGRPHNPGPRPPSSPRPAPPRYHRPAPVYYGGYYARPYPLWAQYYPGYYWGTGYWGPSYGVSVVYDASPS